MVGSVNEEPINQSLTQVWPELAFSGRLDSVPYRHTVMSSRGPSPPGMGDRKAIALHNDLELSTQQQNCLHTNSTHTHEYMSRAKEEEGEEEFLTRECAT